MAKKINKIQAPETLATDKARQFKLTRLKISVQHYLNQNYDWKVTKAISTGLEISEEDKAFRESVVAEFNQRVDALNSATTLNDLDKVKISF